ncbi:murein L,D-transpeptidase catalytic domain-containing protein [Psychrilyobacter sp.]|uniref:murein L,D-transpeptidase catalytic domain-containing protein n=1 Tax=Psychrilyobacter sp. TaxID=2586924 RepID=UPI00301AC43F
MKKLILFISIFFVYSLSFSDFLNNDLYKKLGSPRLDKKVLNSIDSLQSSVGFFKTSTTYTGKNGYSMRLDGLEKWINDNAMRRNIVIHGAKYATKAYINKYGRLGRSWGCPAVD